MNNFLIFPFIFLFGAALLAALMNKNKVVQISLALAGSGGAFICSFIILGQVINSGTQIMSVSNWAPPFGITLVADKMSAAMLLISNFLGLMCVAYSHYEIDERSIKLKFYPLLLILLAGVNGAFVTGDIFNLYVWFEVLLISSFSLLTLGSKRSQLKGALPYVTINLVSSCLFLTGIGALYGLTGSLNFAELSLRMSELPTNGTTLSIAMIFLVAFGIKAAIFPLFFWLPVSYFTPSVTVSAIFAGLLTKVAVYSLIRVFTLIFLKNMELIHGSLLWIAGFTMVTGVLGAASQTEVRKILSFHIVSQIGYMIMGLAFFTSLAMGGALFFIVHNIVVKSNLFLISGAMYHVTGSFELKSQGSLYRKHPFLSLLFLASCFSLAGLPPLSGFWGKLILVTAGLEIHQFILVGISILVSGLTLYSMTKIWIQAYWKPLPEVSQFSNRSVNGLLVPITILALVSLLPALYPEPLIEFFRASGEELMNPSNYIQAVLNRGGTL